MIGGQKYYYFKMCNICQIRGAGGGKLFFHQRIRTSRVSGGGGAKFFYIYEMQKKGGAKSNDLPLNLVWPNINFFFVSSQFWM
jgi:hypothetical protein